MTTLIVCAIILIAAFTAAQTAGAYDRWSERRIERRNIRRVSEYLDRRPW